MIKTHFFGAPEKATTAILIKEAHSRPSEIRKYYVDPLCGLSDLQPEEFFIVTLQYNAQNKAPVTTCINPCLENIQKYLESLPQDIERVLVCDAPYFKKLAKTTKTNEALEDLKPTPWDSFTTVYYVPNYASAFFDKHVETKLELALHFVAQSSCGMPTRESFLNSVSTKEVPCYEFFECLQDLHNYDKITCDIETSGLELGSKILSIAFATSKKDSFALDIDYYSSFDDTRNLIKNKLVHFFATYRKTIIWHNGVFDIKHLIYNYFAKDSSDYKGILRGLKVFFDVNTYEDTKLLTYLATNNTVQNNLSLKEQALPYVGHYEFSKELMNSATGKLIYNQIDVLGTFYVYEKYREQVRENLEDTYQVPFISSCKTICLMELVGMPLKHNAVLKAEQSLSDLIDGLYDKLAKSKVIHDFNNKFREHQAIEATKKLKQKVKTADDFLSTVFNPGSPVHLRYLLHTIYDLPVTHKTDKGFASTSSKSLEAHINKLEGDKDYEDLCGVLKIVIDISEAEKILNTFISAFKKYSSYKDGWKFLYGNFNLGGTKSGRLSSSDPNLQNIPSTGTKYAKLIKSCFQAPPGWLFVGADYSSLEDRIGALLSKDPNKLAVYLDGYDGHSLRAQAYFPDRMPDVTQEFLAAQTPSERVSVINSIGARYPKLRQLSKGPTFALTYLGTFRTLMKNFGLTYDEAVQIEENYHKLYKVADDWAAAEMKKANQRGYAELAFGLRLYTPALSQVIWDQRDTWPYSAKKDLKTATNALGQSYGLLNSHSSNLFMARVWKSPYAEMIFPCAHIHDAQYYMIKNDLNLLKWVNDNLIECMEWNDLDAIRHPEVGLEAELEVYFPSWANPISIPNRISKEEIRTILEEAL